MVFTMISHEVYKLIHLAAIFAFLMGSSVLLLAKSGGRFWKIWTGVASFFILFGGMGLVARLGVGWQGWMTAKVVIWLVITGSGHMIAKRFPEHGKAGFVVTYGLAVVAAWLGIFKP